MRLLDRYWEPLEADFQRYYGLDLAVCCWGQPALSVRRLSVLSRQLPESSETARAMTGGWTVDRELRAQAVDRLGDLVTMYAKSHTKSPSKVKPSEPFPRPQEILGYSKARKPRREGKRVSLGEVVDTLKHTKG